MVRGLVDHVSGEDEDGDGGEPKQDFQRAEQTHHRQVHLHGGLALKRFHSLGVGKPHFCDGQDEEEKSPCQDGITSRVSGSGWAAAVQAEQEAAAKLHKCGEEQYVCQVAKENASVVEVLRRLFGFPNRRQGVGPGVMRKDDQAAFDGEEDQCAEGACHSSVIRVKIEVE